MKQIQECLDRHFADRPPLKHKWQARWHPDFESKVLVLFHYHHVILMYDCDLHQLLYSWWEKPADKRGLDAAALYLRNKFEEDENE